MKINFVVDAFAYLEDSKAKVGDLDSFNSFFVVDVFAYLEYSKAKINDFESFYSLNRIHDFFLQYNWARLR